MKRKKPKYQKIYDDLTSDIHSGIYKIGDKIPSEKELAEQYNVSRITSRKALEIAANRGIVEKKPGLGSYVKSTLQTNKPYHNFSKTIAFIVPAISVYYGLEIIRAIHHLARTEQCMLLMFISEDCLQTEKEILITLQDHSIDGYIIFPVHDENFNNEIFNIIFKNKPIVLIDRYLHDLSCPNVTSNNLEASYDAVKYLFDYGHQNIGILTRSIDNTSTIRDRKEGVYKAYAERNMKISSERWLTGLSPKLADFESEKVKIKQFILKNPDISAFFSFELHFYPIFKSAVSELGKRIPDDYSFICFDSSSPLDNLLNPLTHLKQNEKNIAETAFNLLIKKMDGEEVPYNNRIDVQLIEGSTVAMNPRC